MKFEASDRFQLPLNRFHPDADQLLDFSILFPLHWVSIEVLSMVFALNCSDEVHRRVP